MMMRSWGRWLLLILLLLVLATPILAEDEDDEDGIWGEFEEPDEDDEPVKKAPVKKEPAKKAAPKEEPKDEKDDSDGDIWGEFEDPEEDEEPVKKKPEKPKKDKKEKKEEKKKKPKEEPEPTPADELQDPTLTTTERPLRRDELPEDGFVWPTTDEENFADALPVEHRCSGCRGVAFQIDKALKALMPMGGKRTLSEHEYTEAMECRTKIYDDYGIKKMEDRSRILVGPGLGTEGLGGSQFGGAKWPSRMARQCGILVGDLGEEEVYRLWADHGSEGFPDVFCSPSCGGGPRIKKKQPEEDEKPIKKKRKKEPAKKIKETSIEGPPQVVKVYKKKEITKHVKKNKFVFLLFCAPSFPRCNDLEIQWEKAARTAKKTLDLKEVLFVTADTDEVGTFDFQLERDILPAFLLFRKGYVAPKGITPEEMLRLKEEGDFLNYLQSEVGQYMQDDPATFPRGKLEL